MKLKMMKLQIEASPGLRGCSAGWVLLVAALLLPGHFLLGQDLPAVTDGRHVWLLEPGTVSSGDKPQLTVYHHTDALRRDPERGVAELRKAEPIEGALMPRGVAAGQGRLVVVLDDRRVVGLRPSVSELTGTWEYSQAILTPFPAGCALRSLVVTDDGVWALVRVELESTLKALDLVEQRSGRALPGADGFQFRAMLGLPPGVDLTLPGESPQGAESDNGAPEADQSDAENDSSVKDQVDDLGPAPTAEPIETNPDEAAAGNAANEAEAFDDGSVVSGEEEPGQQPDPLTEDESANEPAVRIEPFVPTYRLIHLRHGQWQTHPLPESFGQPQQARLLARPGQGVPIVLARYSTATSAPIVVMQAAMVEDTQNSPTDSDTPSPEPSPAEQWTSETYRLAYIQNWSAAIVQDQVVVGIERDRSETWLDVELYLLRGGRTAQADITRLLLPTNGLAQWAMLGVGDRAGVFTVPGPLLKPNADGSPTPLSLAGWRSATLDGSTDEQVQLVMAHQPTRLEANLDWLIQIVTYVVAMLLMMLFWRRSPGDGQLRLPERVVLASLDKRIISGLIDLLPGLLIAAAIFEVSWVEIARLWPGTPTEKTLRAMRPGLLVIGITVLHTTIFELITARSIGKWLTGLYVSDFRGKPAPPGASTVRAILRLLDMVALLLLIIPLISPARQRLGDILARTIVVTRLPDPEEERRKREQRQRELEQDDDW